MSQNSTDEKRDVIERRMMSRARFARQAAMRDRLAQRDAEYAAHAAPVTVEERELRNSELGCIMRVEWRGQRCIAPRITHMGSN